MHKDRVTQLQFIKKSEDEYQLVSFADDHSLDVVCLKQCIYLFRRRYPWMEHAELMFVPKTQELLLLKKNHMIIKFKTYIDEQEAEMIKLRISSATHHT